MKNILLFLSIAAICQGASGQELFVFTEPASNMPARSASLKLTGKFPNSQYNDYFKQRYFSELMLGLSKTVMVHVSAGFSDYYSPRLRWESAKVYAKWRFYSNDDVHRHFRLAAFAEGAYTRSPFLYGEINLDGDNDGVQGGLIATQLVNKLALSASASIIKVFAARGFHTEHEQHALEALNYSVSAGFLLFPFNYTNYQQVNVNLYMEMLGMRGFGNKDQMLDLAPALQFIFNSNLKVSAGYRYQVSGHMLRVGEKTWMITLERTFLGALKGSALNRLTKGKAITARM